MLSYQHAYHAGNLADVHKHAVLAWVLDYLTRKDKPLSYIETHAGRGAYDLGSAEAAKTGEAARGILSQGVLDWFGAGHPYARVLAAVRGRRGPLAYPGSPLIAETLLRPGDAMHLAELHPREYEALKAVLGRRATVYAQNGYAMAKAVCPPTPRRGLALIDPSYERKQDFRRAAETVIGVHAKWNVGILLLWYPILAGDPHLELIGTLSAALPTGLWHAVHFPPLKDGHRLVGSGLFILNPPYGLEPELARLSGAFGQLSCSREGG